ncbi:hypothetical protein AGMMS49942_03680 [Spirochaetia bacterium]|nr:hypothetical protein AGMMS49942_03680 [Spirochaetia bacterium]
MGFWSKDCRGMVEAIEIFPYGEFWKVLEAAKVAIEKKDMDALTWCMKRIIWFHDVGEVTDTELGNETLEALFNSAYRFTDDPPPVLIADLVALDKDEPETPDAAAASEALDVLRQFLDGREDMARKDYQAALKSIDALRGKVSPAVGEGAA